MTAPNHYIKAKPITWNQSTPIHPWRGIIEMRGQEIQIAQVHYIGDKNQYMYEVELPGLFTNPSNPRLADTEAEAKTLCENIFNQWISHATRLCPISR